MITVRIPDDLRDRIDADRPSTQSREAWVREACEDKLMLAPVQRAFSDSRKPSQ